MSTFSALINYKSLLKKRKYMVETFTPKITKCLGKKNHIDDDLQLNAEDRLFYALLDEPMDQLLQVPSDDSVRAILKFSGDYLS
ncbi:hypothetical protein H8S90_02675 [Olivibacter sp. SDN3]|uniref:hypothetical protein n=1 Tax=Olivibacter sp. SDN3 TaxID=2764720 RepID=UPI001651A50F|nr:hypothetical protein [Olivibacter sp. SDN3]QNL50535.1 hypothetical protein H8S90_02675 [Olivibacter sp. SDN3]